MSKWGENKAIFSVKNFPLFFFKGFLKRRTNFPKFFFFFFFELKIQEEELLSLFKEAGETSGKFPKFSSEVEAVRLVRDKISNKGKGIAFFLFRNKVGLNLPFLLIISSFFSGRFCHFSIHSFSLIPIQFPPPFFHFPHFTK